MVLRNLILRRLRANGGWAMMDAVYSTLIVAMAFVATTAAFDNSNKAAARESKNTQAMAIAQGQINWMRSIGQADEGALLALNNTTKTIAYRGTNFTVRFKAITTTGVGEGGVEACSVDRASASVSAPLPENRHYIYMRVAVEYPGMIKKSGPTGGTGITAAEPIALDSNFAAEGAAVDASSGMLRVYVAGPTGTPQTVTGVTLTKDSTTYSAIATQADKGCYLFGGLGPGAYTIKVSAGGKQDIYMSAGADNIIQRTYQMPTGVMRSTTVTVASPVSVSPTYRAYSVGTSTSVAIDPRNDGAGNVNGFVKSSSMGNYGYWTGYSSDVLQATNSSFFVNQGGALFPLANSGNSDKSYLYPSSTGYAGFAGPCRVNDPGASNWTQIPSSLTDTIWTGGGVLSPRPELWLSLLRPTVTWTPTAKTTPSYGFLEYGDKWAFWSQGLTTAKVQVALVGDTTGANTPTQCNSGFAVGSDTAAKWFRLPGTFTTLGGNLGDIASALPTGTYVACIRVDYNYQTQKYNKGVFSSGWVGSPTTGNATEYASIGNQSLTYKAVPKSASTTLTTSTTSEDLGNASTTSCGDPSKWT